MMIYTIEAESCKLDLSVVTWYFSTSNFTTKAADTPASTNFIPRVTNPGSIGINLYSAGKTSGGSRLEIGEVVIENCDGAYDELARYSFDGRKFTIRRGEDTAAYPSGFTTLFIGTAESIDVNWNTITFRLRDKSYLLDAPLLTSVYGGTNALPAGIDGVPGDIKGNIKPRIFGVVANIPPVLVNSSKLIYQVHSGSAATTPFVVSDQGVALTFGTDRASNAAMQATAPAASHYDTCKAEGLFRLGSTPNGMVTVECCEGVSSADQTVAQKLKQIAGLMGITAYAADVTALDAINASGVGLWVNDSMTAAQALDIIAESIGAYWYFDRLERFRMGQFDIASGSPVATLYDRDCIDIKSLPPNDKSLVTWKVSLNYSFIEATMNDSDFAGSVAVGTRNYYSKKFRTVKTESGAIKSYSLLAVERVINSRLISEAQAQTECDRQSDIYTYIPPRRMFEVTIPIDIFNFNLMDYISLQASASRKSSYTMFDSNARLIGYNLDLANNTAVLTLW